MSLYSMSYTLQMSCYGGAPWFPALLPISQWAPSPFLVSACTQMLSSEQLYTSFLELLCCAGQGTRLTCAVPHPSLLPWQPRLTALQREWLYGMWLQDFWCMSPLMPAAARIPRISKTHKSCHRGHPAGQGRGAALHNASQSTARKT